MAIAMGYSAPGKIFENMLQLTVFSLYMEVILNKNNGYFHMVVEFI